jgi:hypothetical protein
VLDGKEVPVISAYFEDSLGTGEPAPLQENVDRVFQGSIFLGEGFLLSHEEADQMKQRDSRLEKASFMSRITVEMHDPAACCGVSKP